MGYNLDDILREADEIIEGQIQKEAEKKPPQAETDEDEDIFKLAEALTQQGEQEAASTEEPAPTEKVATKEQSAPQEQFRQPDMIEKVAEALAITEACAKIEEFEKIAQFEEAAKEKGFSEEQIEQFVQEKFASKGNLLRKATIPAAILGSAGGGAGAYTVGKKKGKERGYDKALRDVDQAMRAYYR